MQAAAVVTGGEATDSTSERYASTSGRTESDDGQKGRGFWGQAAVGAGAVALVAVFVVATVGVDLGLGGRRASTQSPNQVRGTQAAST